MSKPKHKDYQYWIDQFDNGRDDHEYSHIQMGKALWALHGPKGQKTGQLWKTDPEADGLTKFSDYCARKWPGLVAVKLDIGWPPTKRRK